MKFFLDLFKPKKRVEKIDVKRRFELYGRVGQGSMSRVWRARDAASGKTVALKILDKEKLKRLDARFVGREKPTEGEIALELKHPYIVKTYEHGITTENEQFLVMEFVEGLSLSYLVDAQNERMKAGRLKYMIQLAEAIEFFHQKNYIHRDICPRNVLVDEHDDVKLIDFGLAVPNTAAFQAPGNRTGTANYMAPELIKRQKTDQRIDVFSYSVTCFEMYTKKMPWEGGQTMEMIVQHLNSPPDDVRELAPEIDPEVADVIMRGLSREPRDRWRSMTELLAPLREAQARLAGGAGAKPA